MLLSSHLHTRAPAAHATHTPIARQTPPARVRRFLRDATHLPRRPITQFINSQWCVTLPSPHRPRPARGCQGRRTHPRGRGDPARPPPTASSSEKFLAPPGHATHGLVSYSEFASWTKDRLADVAVDDINYTTRSLVDVGAIQAKAQAKIGA